MADAYQHARNDAALFDQPGRGQVTVAGKDAVAFLQNLCTNDVKNLPVGQCCEAFLTTAKARVVAHLFATRLLFQGDGNCLWLDTVPGLGEKVLRHLDHYLVSEAVELADRGGEVAQMYVCGPAAPEVLDRFRAAADRAADAFRGGPGGFVCRRDHLGLPGYAVFWPHATAAEARRLLTGAGATPADPEAYEVLRIEAGFPEFGKDIDENRLVMEVGRTAQAISYTKGCYLGQEPIVMARDRGHVNRTLLGLKLLEGGPAPAGARVLRDGEEVGQVTSSVRSPRVGAAVALAYLRRGSQEPGTGVEVEADGRRPAEVAALPFE
jgi:folate-binding protein YgfZ